MAVSGKKFVIGCAIGCGALLLVAILAVIGFAIWLNADRELLEPQALLGSETRGYAEWTLDIEDPGTRGFVEALIEALQSIPSGSDELPPWLGGWMQQRRNRDLERDLKGMFPTVVAWTVSPGETPEEDLHLYTLSIKPLGNRLVLGDWFMGMFLKRVPEVEIERYADEKIYRFEVDSDRSLALFIRGVDVFLTSDLETARMAVDRLSGVRAGREPSNLDRVFESTADRGPLRIAISNRDGQLERLWRRLADPSAAAIPEVDLIAPLRSLAVAGGLQADGSFAVRLDLETPSAGWAANHGEALAEELRDGLSWIELPYEIEQRTVGERVELQLKVPDLIQAIRDQTKRLEQEGVETEDGGRVKVGF